VSLRDDALASVRAIVSGGHDRDVLRILRDESAYCVTVVRLKNDERKAAKP
jgi:hypothetical protein